MFKRLAKSGLVRFGLVRPQRAALGPIEAGFSNRSYSNDNLAGFRRPAASAGKRRSPTPVLTCHWFDRGGRLECCWHTETGDAAAGGFDDQWNSKPVRACASPPARSRCPALAG